MVPEIVDIHTMRSFWEPILKLVAWTQKFFRKDTQADPLPLKCNATPLPSVGHIIWTEGVVRNQLVMIHCCVC